MTRPVGLHREGNALLNVAFTVNATAGPALAGVIVLLLGAQIALVADAVTFVIAAILLGVRADLPSSCVEPERALARLREAMAYVRDRPLLRRMLAGEAAAAAFFSMILPIEIVFIIETLGSDASGYSIVLTAWGTGMIAGGIVSARLPNVPLPRLLATSATALVAAHFGMGLSTSVASAAAWSVIGGLGNGAYCRRSSRRCKNAQATRFKPESTACMKEFRPPWVERDLSWVD